MLEEDKKQTEMLEANDTLIILPSDKKCPVCGNEDAYCTITISIEPYNGIYCQKCYAKWIKDNIPEMIVVKK